MSPLADPDAWRGDSREGWESAAAAWGQAAEATRAWGIDVSTAMLDGVALQAGERVLELAAGPGDTGFMAAEQIAPAGTLISSDGAEAMLEVARARAAAQGITNVEFRALELEWIDLPTADVDVVLCRWGIMLVVDPAAAAREIRRVLRPGGRAALAVWDLPERNPWSTIVRQALRDGDLVPAPDPAAPTQFSLAADGDLAALLHDAGFVEVAVEPVAMLRHFTSIADYLTRTGEISPTLRATIAGLDAGQRAALESRIADAAAPFTDHDGSLALPGSSLVAIASA